MAHLTVGDLYDASPEGWAKDAALVWRWIGIGAVTIVAAALTLFAMLQLMPRRVSDPTS